MGMSPDHDDLCHPAGGYFGRLVVGGCVIEFGDQFTSRAVNGADQVVEKRGRKMRSLAAAEQHYAGCDGSPSVRVAHRVPPPARAR